jgi:uncharacterized membrane protein
MAYFMDPKITTSLKLLEILYIVMGLVSIYAGIKNLRDKENSARVGTAIFWCALGIVFVFGRWLPDMFSGILVIIMMLPAIFRKVKPGKAEPGNPKKSAELADKIGLKLFIPALAIGVAAVIVAIFTKLSPLVGVGIGVLISMILLMIFNRDNKPSTFLNDSRRMLDVVGPLSMLPMLLASLGAIFTKAGVGGVVAGLVGNIIPKGNVTIGIIVFGIGMALFTMIMGNAFAAITVMTVGIGAPFVLAYGANPVFIGSLALTCGYCGTLCTPMAANFNIVPVALLEMKDKYGVIKKQVLIAVIMLVFQICYMLIAK